MPRRRGNYVGSCHLERIVSTVSEREEEKGEKEGLDDEDVLGWTTGRKGETDDYQNSGGVSISQAQRLNQ